MSSKAKPSTGSQSFGSKIAETMGRLRHKPPAESRPQGAARRRAWSNRSRAELAERNQQGAAQGFGGAPEQLVAHREEGEILGPEAELAEPSHGDAQGSGDRRR